MVILGNSTSQVLPAFSLTSHFTVSSISLKEKSMPDKISEILHVAQAVAKCWNRHDMISFARLFVSLRGAGELTASSLLKIPRAGSNRPAIIRVIPARLPISNFARRRNKYGNHNSFS